MNGGMSDIRFQSLVDEQLSDLWYAMSGEAIKYPDHFGPLADELLTELIARRGEGLNPWLLNRYKLMISDNSRLDALFNRCPPNEKSDASAEPTLIDGPKPSA